MRKVYISSIRSADTRRELGVCQRKVSAKSGDLDWTWVVSVVRFKADQVAEDILSKDPDARFEVFGGSYVKLKVMTKKLSRAQLKGIDNVTDVLGSLSPIKREMGSGNIGRGQVSGKKASEEVLQGSSGGGLPEKPGSIPPAVWSQIEQKFEDSWFEYAGIDRDEDPLQASESTYGDASGFVLLTGEAGLSDDDVEGIVGGVLYYVLKPIKISDGTFVYAGVSGV